MRYRFLNHSLSSILALLLLLGIGASHAREQVVDHIPGVNKVNAEQLIELATEIPNLLIIDSRIVSDRAHGHIEGSTSLPDINTDCDSLAETIPDKQQPALFYCNGPKCGRSAHALQIAQKCGYTNLHWFFGGFEEWRDKNYPYIKK